MDRELTEKIRRRYNRNAVFYDSMDRMIREAWRRRVIGKAAGNVLEVGVGTGKNLSYYNPAICTKVTGIDFSPGMLAKARPRAEQAPVAVELMEMDAQAMDFADGTFDAVVSTCVFCSVPDPISSLREVKRVCKRDGKILFLEHMRVDWPIVRMLIDVMNPVSVGLMGININRRTVENIEKAGLTLLKVENLMGPLLRYIEAGP